MLQALYKRRTDESVEEVLKSAGFEQPTPLQEQYLTLALQGRDILVESSSGEGKTVAQLLPLMFSSPPRKKGPYALILVDTAEAIEKIEREYRRFSGSKLRNRPLVSLGKSPNVKKELRPLAKHPGIIVGTTERIIDHLRRGNISLENISQVVINVPENPEHLEFDRDVEYILAKTPSKAQTSLFAASQERNQELAGLLRRPYTLAAQERKGIQPHYHLFTVLRKDPDILLRILFAQGFESVLIVPDSREARSKIEKALRVNGFRIVSGNQQEEASGDRRTETSPFEKRCTIAEEIRPDNAILSYEALIFYGLPASEESFTAIDHSVHSAGRSPYICLIVEEEKSHSFTQLQEKTAMKTSKEQVPQKEDVLKGKLKSIVKQIKEDEDPELLNQYKKIIKKSVPITMRAYVAAYLFKKAVEGESPEPLAGDDGDKQTIFVSIGKNKKVFPRDLSRLFRKSLDLQPRDIGNIKVLDNYSFVDIPQSQAQRAIEVMDGIEFRGKNITVNFARKKEKKGGGRDNRDNRDNRDERGG